MITNIPNIQPKINKKTAKSKKTALSVSAKLNKNATYATIGNSIIAGAGFSENAKNPKLGYKRCTKEERFNKHLLASSSCCKSISVDKEGDVSLHHTCKKRLCLWCARNRQYKLNVAYAPKLEHIIARGSSPFYFVTLTTPRAFADDLVEKTDKLRAVWRKLYKYANEHKIVLSGLRKLEIAHEKITFEKERSWLKNARTMEEQERIMRGIERAEEAQRQLIRGGDHDTLREAKERLHTYHPHFHILIQGKEQAEFLVQKWLSYFPEARLQAQNITEYTGDMRELTKYIAKIVDTREGIPSRLSAAAIGFIYRSLLDKRTFFAMGEVRSLKISDEEQQAWIKANIEQTEEEEEKVTEEEEIHVEQTRYNIKDSKEVMEAIAKSGEEGLHFVFNKDKLCYIAELTEEIIVEGQTFHVKRDLPLTTKEEWNIDNPAHMKRSHAEGIKKYLRSRERHRLARYLAYAREEQEKFSAWQRGEKGIYG